MALLSLLQDSDAALSRPSSRDEVFFADLENLERCMNYVNYKLDAFGVPLLKRTGNEEISLVSACDAIYGLLQKQQTDAEKAEAMLDQQHSLKLELKRLDSKLERCETQVAAKESELQSQYSKEKKAQSSHRAQVEKLQAERDEFHRLAQAAQQVKTQQTYELRKKEKEYARLQERLSAQLSDKKEKVKATIEVVRPGQKEGRQRATWGVKPDNADFSNKIISVFEESKQKLLEENKDLKTTLQVLQCEVHRLVDTEVPQSSVDRNSEASESLETPGQTQEGLLNLPYHLTREKVETGFQQDLALIRDRLKKGCHPEFFETPVPTGKEVEQERQGLQGYASRLSNEELELEKARSKLNAEKVTLTAAQLLWHQRVEEGGSQGLS